MEDKIIKLKDIILKHALAKSYARYFLESEEDLDTILENIVKDLEDHKLNSEEEEKVIKLFGEELDKIPFKKGDLDSKSEFLKEAQRHSETWKNVQKAKDIIDKIKKK
jgi:hypothetical protein